MNIEKEREAFEKAFAQTEFYRNKADLYNLLADIDDESFDFFRKNGCGDYSIGEAQATWSAWQAVKTQAVMEGFVLVPKDKVSHFYQDNDEPENFCNSSDDWDCLGDGIDKDQIMVVNKHTQANISTERFYGAWKLIETSYGTRWKFELFKSESEAMQAVIESQEQVND